MDFCTQLASISVEKWGSYGHLKNSIWPTLSRNFEYLICFQNFYNCLIMPPTLKKLSGHIAFGACVGAWVGAWVTLFVPTVTFKPLKLES